MNETKEKIMTFGVTIPSLGTPGVEIPATAFLPIQHGLMRTQQVKLHDPGSWEPTMPQVHV